MAVGCAGTVRTSKTPRELIDEGLSPAAAKDAAITNTLPEILEVCKPLSLLSSLYTDESRHLRVNNRHNLRKASNENVPQSQSRLQKNRIKA